MMAPPVHESSFDYRVKYFLYKPTEKTDSKQDIKTNRNFI